MHSLIVVVNSDTVVQVLDQQLRARTITVHPTDVNPISKQKKCRPVT